MSGTSLDGLDIALCKAGEDNISVLHFITEEYHASLSKRINRIQSKQTVDLQEVTILNTELAHLHADWVLEALQKWGVSKESIDVIASHGQTIYHHPGSSLTSTLQIVVIISHKRPGLLRFQIFGKNTLRQEGRELRWLN